MRAGFARFAMGVSGKTFWRWGFWGFARGVFLDVVASRCGAWVLILPGCRGSHMDRAKPLAVAKTHWICRAKPLGEFCPGRARPPGKMVDAVRNEQGKSRAHRQRGMRPIGNDACQPSASSNCQRTFAVFAALARDELQREVEPSKSLTGFQQLFLATSDFNSEGHEGHKDRRFGTLIFANLH